MSLDRADELENEMVDSKQEVMHTPGPWELDGPSTTHVTDEDYHAIRAGCGFWSGSKNQREPGFSITGHMSAADACLIAAAPDLLAALIDLHAQVSKFCEEEGEADFYTGRADAAIAKATGTQQPR